MNSPTEQQISNYLSRVVASGALGKSERRLKLLKHLILAEAQGSGGQLKAYSIGLDIFAKKEDFDPQTDSVVRVEVGRLRAAIAHFEYSEFADCELKVDIPKGTYRPNFSIRKNDLPQARDEIFSPGHKPFQSAMLAIAAIFVVSFGLIFLDFFDDSTLPNSKIVVQLNDLEGGRGSETSAILREGLLANKSVSILVGSDGGLVDPDAEFLLSGSTAVDVEHTTVSIELINAKTNSLAWSKAVQISNEDFRQELSKGLGQELRVRLFGVSKELLDGRDPENLTPEQLFVVGTWVPGPAVNAVGWELERVQLMEIALKKDPNFGAAHSVVADKLAYLANVYGPLNTPEILKKTNFHAQRAMELAPLDADVMFNVAQSQWHRGMISESLATMARVTELDPNHTLARYLALVIPYSCLPAPDTIVEQAIAFDAALSVDNPIRWLTLTWIGWLHAYRGDYELALEAERRAALIFEIPYTFMRHAMLLNKLGRTAEAARVLERQKVNWPEIDTAHFASVTIPRLCNQQSDGQPFVGLYEELDAALSE